MARDPVDCDCCAGETLRTPRRVTNPPGLAQVDYRAGTYGHFMATLRSRLSSAELPALAALTSRDGDDFTLALADVLASHLDVVNFYAERFANEHYLRTATERLSVLEMARLIGYELAPGVAASTHLAFTLQSLPGVAAPPITIPVGTRVQSVPGQDEQAQTFETVDAADARAEWNALELQQYDTWRPTSGDRDLWLAGVGTGLSVGDAILIVGDARRQDPTSERWDVRVLNAVEEDATKDRTRVAWADPLGSTSPFVPPAGDGVEVHVFRQRTALFGHNAPDPSLLRTDDAGESIAGIRRRVSPGRSGIDRFSYEWDDFAIDPDALDLAVENQAIVAGGWLALVSNDTRYGTADLPGYVELYGVSRVLHRSLSAYGLAGRITTVVPEGENLTATLFKRRDTLVLAQSEPLHALGRPLFAPAYGANLSLAHHIEGWQPGRALALSGKRQRIRIAPAVKGLQLVAEAGGSASINEGDELHLTAAPVRVSGSGVTALDPDAFLALLGEPETTLRLALEDRDGATGTLTLQGDQLQLAPPLEDDPVVREIVFVADATDALTHDRDRTHVRLAQATSHVYARDSVRLNGNVAAATHGEAVEAVLGSGDGRVGDQVFTLNQGPLTHVSAATASGRASTLEVRVNDVRWDEVPSLFGAADDAQQFTTQLADDGITTVRFGDGQEGARLPSGTSNVRALWRKGIGAGGNLGDGVLTTLLSRPLGVSEVTNPAPATGGEDPEPLDRARSNAPLTVLTLDRAVSISDYANFARAFGGIDKAHALWVPAGPARGVFITVAGPDGAAIAPTSATHRNLRDALIAHGDPLMPVRIVTFAHATFRCRLALKVLDAYEGGTVFNAVETALREHFSFDRRDFGQTVSADELAAVAQATAGVEAVHVATLHRSDEAATLQPRLFASVPTPSLTAAPEAAQILTLDDAPLDLEVLL